ncbi:MAG TPA: hypothetical protein VND64_26860 [Pirellulales bacterium]|nr:hypothetical protein [Pirellulales bacterium]
MASPFTVFRKNQRAMMAVVGILCMIGFTIGGVASSMIDSRAPAGSDPIVVTTVNGPIREMELRRMRESRRMLNVFMLNVIVTAKPKPYEAEIWALQNNISLKDQFGPDTEEDVVQTAVLADRAKRMGIVISDEAIFDFLRERTENKVSNAQYSEIVKKLNLSEPEVFEWLRTVLSASRLARMTFFSTQVTPAQRWDYYRRLNQHAEAEVLPLDVDDYIVQDSDPSDEDLRAFFEKNKETEPDPQSPEFGFKVPRKAAFRYFVARYDSFVDADDVTEEEITKHYEENKDRLYRFTDLGDDDVKPASDAPQGSESKDEPAEESESPKEKTDLPALPGETPADETPAEQTPGDTTPPEGQPDAEAPSEPEAQSQSSNSPRAETWISFRGSAVARNSFRGAAAPRQPGLGTDSELPIGDPFAYFAVKDDEPLEAKEDNQPADEEKPPIEAAVSDSADDEDLDPETSGEAPSGEPGDPADSTELQADEAAPGESAEAEPPAARSEKRKPSSETQKVPAPPPPQISSDLLLIRDIRQGPKPKYDPQWKVEASIRKELAGQKAVAKMKAKLQSIQKEFRHYLRNLDDEDDQQSSGPDYAALAKQHGLEAHTTELLARYEFQAEHPDLAGATFDQENQMAARRFGDEAYVIPLNQSHFLRDIEGNRFLIWKTEEVEAYVPEFDERREEVLRAVKLKQARELALEEAQRMAEEAGEARKPLADVFDERAKEVRQTGRFSWLTASPMDMMHQGRAMPRLSEVEGVQSPGAEFMRTVFSLEARGVGAALNHPQTMVYVVRVKNFVESEKVLRDLFMIDSYDKYVQAGADDQLRAYKDWREGIEKEAKIEWKRPPDQPTVRTAMK